MTKCGLYIHIPFCDSKCGYCDFYSIAVKDRPTAPLVACVIAELRDRLRRGAPTIRTVFIGGGTPTVLQPGELETLFGALREMLSPHAVAEFTVEANPATVDDEKLSILTAAGVDRISMGAQSWHVPELEALERLHSPDDIEPGVALVRAHGIERLNLDLIFGIPGQSMASWTESIDRTLALGVDHLSCYGLTYEEGTRLTAQRRAGRIESCPEGIETDMYLHVIDRLSGAGFEQYEISSFARPGQRCRHNMTYWRNEPYIGAGPSAGGFVNGVRYKNVSDIGDYVKRVSSGLDPANESERVEGPVLAAEIILMQLRLAEGMDLERFAQRTGIDARDALAPSLERHEAAGLVDLSGRALVLTARGRLITDTIIADLYADLFASVGVARPAVSLGDRPA